MKRIALSFISFTIALLAIAQNAKDSLTFTTILENGITSIKNQNRSGTCWDYATIAFIESELLRKTGKTYNLSEMFVANKDYMDCAEYHVRLHGDSKFSEGGSADDVFSVISRHGICPEDAMAKPGEMMGDTLANFTEFFSVLEPYVKAVANNKAKRLSPQWRVGMQSILDAYLGKCPESFMYEGKEYTPKSFAESLNINKDDYISITSFMHHPFYEWFVIEAPYKWRPCRSYNIPYEEMMETIDHALQQGYTVAWGGDVSGNGFDRKGLAKAGTPEQVPSQGLRQVTFDNWQSTYDHVMLIFGIAKDQNGCEYYMVKNSWGDAGNYHGIRYMTKTYIAIYTTYIFLNKEALPKSISDKIIRG